MAAVVGDQEDAGLDVIADGRVYGGASTYGQILYHYYERLAGYLVGDDVQIVPLNADLNGDGKVTDADAILLHQQLAVAEGAK